MSKILLLYDTHEDDLARDVKDLVAELGCEVVMIPKSADRGNTLQSKEDAHFADADGAIFLITPGSLRDGKMFPSPSVADEMGRAKELFKSNPENVTYLVQKGCQIQVVDQRSYVQFERDSIRSVILAVTGLVRNLKAARLLEKPGKMFWEVNAYYRSAASGKEGPFCPACHDGKSKVVRMAPEGQDFRCTVCGHLLGGRPGPLIGYADGPSFMDEKF